MLLTTYILLTTNTVWNWRVQQRTKFVTTKCAYSCHI